MSDKSDWITWEDRCRELGLQNDLLREMVVDRDNKLQELQTELKERKQKKSKAKKKK
jgi:ribosomal protein S6